MSNGRGRHHLFQLRPWRRHSLVLAVASVVYIAYGLSLILVEQPHRISQLVIATQLMPFRGWGAVWVCAGIFALASTRWPPWSESWGYATMTYVAAFWSACYWLGLLFLNTPLAGIPAGLVWAMVAFLWWAISGLTNPDDMARDYGDHYAPPQGGSDE